jgi:hypothetical protein
MWLPRKAPSAAPPISFGPESAEHAATLNPVMSLVSAARRNLSAAAFAARRSSLALAVHAGGMRAGLMSRSISSSVRILGGSRMVSKVEPLTSETSARFLDEAVYAVANGWAVARSGVV